MYFAIGSLISDRLKDTYAVKAYFVTWIQIVIERTFNQANSFVFKYNCRWSMALRLKIFRKEIRQMDPMLKYFASKCSNWMKTEK